MRTTSQSFLMTAIGLAFAAACSSSATPQNGGTGYGSGGSTTLFVGHPDHKRVSEECACEVVRDAYAAKIGALGCTIQVPVCPDYVRQQSKGADVDHGDIVDCNTFVRNTLQTCQDIMDHPCVFNPIAGPPDPAMSRSPLLPTLPEPISGERGGPGASAPRGRPSQQPSIEQATPAIITGGRGLVADQSSGAGLLAWPVAVRAQPYGCKVNDVSGTHEQS